MIALLVVGAVVLLIVICTGTAVGLYLFRYRDSGNSSSAASSAAPASPAAPAGSAPAGSVTCTWTKAAGGSIKDVGTPPAQQPGTGTVSLGLVTNLGTVRVRIDVAKTPCTAASLAYLAGQHFFDGSPCHRLVDSGIFVLQCGDPSGTGSGGPSYQFQDENLNGTSGGVYRRGTVAMANAGPNTNGSQFFIVFKDSPLPPQYTPFGTVTDGLSIVDQVAAGGDDGAYGSSAGGGHPNIKIVLQSATVS
jgi:peptidyl-prolyl cis-trans isomerase B (cyclophilin B)